MYLRVFVVAVVVFDVAAGVCQSGDISFIADSESSILSDNRLFFDWKQVQSVSQCTSLCFDHPFCIAVSLNITEGKLLCGFSYATTHDACVGQSVTQYQVGKSAVLLRCLKCVTADTGAKGVSGPYKTNTVFGGTTRYLPNSIVENQPEIAYEHADGCSYTKHPTVAVLAMATQPLTVSNLGVSSGYGLNESTCAKLCGQHPQCRFAVFIQSPNADGTVYAGLCHLVGNPAQLQEDLASQFKVSGYYEALLANIKCEKEKTNNCNIRARSVTWTNAKLLENENVVSSHSIETCVEMCYQTQLSTGNCASVLFEVSSALCYLLNNSYSQLINDSKTPEHDKETKYYAVELAALVDCYRHHTETNLSMEFAKTNYSREICTNNLTVVNNVDIQSDIDSTDLHPKILAILRQSWVTADFCRLFCSLDSRCNLVYFANTKESAAEMQLAANHSGTPAKCLLYSYNQLAVDKPDVFGRSKFLNANKIAKTKPGSGITRFSDISCEGSVASTTTSVNKCSAKSVRGNLSTEVSNTTATAITAQLYVSGSSECDQLCSLLNGCSTAYFISSANVAIGDLCAVFFTQPTNEYFIADEYGSGYLRFDFNCGNFITSHGEAINGQRQEVVATTKEIDNNLAQLVEHLVPRII